MSSTEQTVGLILWFWITGISIWATYIQNRLIKKVKFHRGNVAENLVKNSIFTPIQNFKNAVFFITYKPDESESEPLKHAVKIGKRIEIFYFVQLALTGTFCIVYFDSV